MALNFLTTYIYIYIYIFKLLKKFTLIITIKIMKHAVFRFFLREKDHVREGEKMKMMESKELMLFFIFLFLIRRINDLVTNF